jgi:hypothetical protein
MLPYIEYATGRGYDVIVTNGNEAEALQVPVSTFCISHPHIH